MNVFNAAAVLAGSSMMGAAGLIGVLAQNHGIADRASVAYVSAAANAPCPIDYRIIASIGGIESGHGTHGGGHLDDSGHEVDDSGQPLPAVSEAGARGPTQFMPATWDSYGVDGDGDGVADIDDVDDAAASTANYLCANGVATQEDVAIYQYNHSDEYVADVKDRAASYPYADMKAIGAAGEGPAPAPPVPGAPPAAPTPAPPPVPIPEDKGRICGIQEWAQPKNTCAADAQKRAGYLWKVFGQMLDKGDTPKLHGLWVYLNGHPKPPPPPPAPPPPPPPPPNQMVSAPAPGPAPPPPPGAALLNGSDGLDPGFAQNVANMAANAPGAVWISSGFRTVDEQISLGGAQPDCGEWVACVYDTDGDGSFDTCGSMHCKGLAADLGFGTGDTNQWTHDHAGEFGLCYPMAYEDWHIEPAGLRC